jgi:hypothetical protein
MLIQSSTLEHTILQDTVDDYRKLLDINKHGETSVSCLTN